MCVCLCVCVCVCVLVSVSELQTRFDQEVGHMEEKEARLQHLHAELQEQRAALQEQTREREAASMNQMVQNSQKSAPKYITTQLIYFTTYLPHNILTTQDYTTTQQQSACRSGSISHKSKLHSGFA